MPLPIQTPQGYFFSTGPLVLRFCRMDKSLLNFEDELVIRKQGVGFARYPRRYFSTAEDAILAQSQVPDATPYRRNFREILALSPL